MFHISASSPSLFVCFARCTADDLQSVCIGSHRDSYRQNSKGNDNHWLIMLQIQKVLLFIHVIQNCPQEIVVK